MRSFPGEVTAVAAARSFADEQLRHMRPKAAELVEITKLIVSELATNAVLHAASSFDVAVTQVTGGIRIEVTDRGPGRPQVRDRGPTSAGGRGLRIVETLADDWGWSESGDEKTVWALLRPSPRSGDAVQSGDRDASSSHRA